METLKIAIFCWESLYTEMVGGLARVASKLAETLAQNHEVHFFTRGNRDQELNNVAYHCCIPWGTNIVDYCRDMSIKMVERFRELDHPKFDLLHFHDWHTLEALHLLKERDTVFSYHSTEYGRNGNRWGDWWESREISGKEWYAGLIAKRITAISHKLKQELMQLYNIPDWKIDVVPNGINPDEFKLDLDPGQVKQRYGIHPLAPLILFGGRIVYQKGPDLLADAIPLVLAKRWDARFLFTGEGDLRFGLESKLAGMPAKFLGFLPHPEFIQLLNACDLVAIPSRNEPFGLMLLEAWAAEKPVVATDVGGLSENIENFVDGIKVYLSPESIAWGINYLLDDARRAKLIGRRGRAKLDLYFRWEAIADQMLETYRKVLG